MTYYAVTAMASNIALRDRIASAAATEGEADPFGWLNRNIYTVVARADWVSAWDYAEENKTVNVNPDTGARDDVINDGMILAAVQAIQATESP
jgi:hypothetical protein